MYDHKVQIDNVFELTFQVTIQIFSNLIYIFNTPIFKFFNTPNYSDGPIHATVKGDLMLEGTRVLGHKDTYIIT